MSVDLLTAALEGLTRVVSNLHIATEAMRQTLIAHTTAIEELCELVAQDSAILTERHRLQSEVNRLEQITDFVREKGDKWKA